MNKLVLHWNFLSSNKVQANRWMVRFHHYHRPPCQHSIWLHKQTVNQLLQMPCIRMEYLKLILVVCSLCCHPIQISHHHIFVLFQMHFICQYQHKAYPMGTQHYHMPLIPECNPIQELVSGNTPNRYLEQKRTQLKIFCKEKKSLCLIVCSFIFIIKLIYF